MQLSFAAVEAALILAVRSAGVLPAPAMQHVPVSCDRPGPSIVTFAVQ